MDYANSRRIKVWGSAEVIEGDEELLAVLQDPAYGGRVERAIRFQIEAWDINCPQHIHKRFSIEQIAPTIEKLQDRIRELEKELARYHI